jgi:chromosome segregation ATPase
MGATPIVPRSTTNASLNNNNNQNQATDPRRGSAQADSKATFKKPGQTMHLAANNLSNNSTSSIPTVHSRSTHQLQQVSSNDTSKATLLTINTNNNVVLTAAASSVTSSPNSSSTLSARSKTELKLNKEIERLNALCESRTKELSMLKLKLKETHVSFEAVTIAFKYLSCDLNGFEVTSLRSKLSSTKRKHDERVRAMTSEIEEKEKRLQTTHESLARLNQESNETKAKLEKQLATLEEEYKTQLGLVNMEHELIVKDLKQEKETSVKRLNKVIDAMKIENEKTVFELKEQLENKTSVNAELEGRVREFEETLAKDKDERIQRLLDSQRNLEKEIESLKAALDIKNLDLFDLRTKNNELTTKLENYNELNMKVRRYKQEVEQLSAILKNKHEAERRTSEHNRLLALKIEVKNKENQRLSMANEQLQFRLQSQPNLSFKNADGSLNSSFTSYTPENEQQKGNDSSNEIGLQSSSTKPRVHRTITVAPTPDEMENDQLKQVKI